MAENILFRDFDPWFKPDRTNFNKVGYITKYGTVIYPMWRHVRERRIERIQRHRHTILERSLTPDQERNVETFFTKNQRKLNLFDMGMRKLALSADLSFFENPIRLPLLEPISDAEHKRRWAQFLNHLQPFDNVALIDTQSKISRAIAKFDQGTWSHTAMYLGQGRIVEAITSGVVERGIEVYRFPRYRLGIYRVVDEFDEPGKIAMKNFALTQVGKGYNYSGVLRLCAEKLLGVRHPMPPSPNDMLISEMLNLIFTV
jgi:hypothetical protein